MPGDQLDNAHAIAGPEILSAAVRGIATARHEQIKMMRELRHVAVRVEAGQMVVVRHEGEADDLHVRAFGGVGQRVGDERITQLAGKQQEFPLRATAGDEVVGTTAAVGWSHPTAIGLTRQKLLGRCEKQTPVGISSLAGVQTQS